MNKITIDICEKRREAWTVRGLCPLWLTGSGGMHVYPDDGTVRDCETSEIVLTVEPLKGRRMDTLRRIARALAAFAMLPVELSDEVTNKVAHYAPPADETAEQRAARCAHAVRSYRGRVADSSPYTVAVRRAEQLASQDGRGLLISDDITQRLTEIDWMIENVRRRYEETHACECRDSGHWHGASGCPEFGIIAMRNADGTIRSRACSRCDARGCAEPLPRNDSDAAERIVCQDVGCGERAGFLVRYRLRVPGVQHSIMWCAGHVDAHRGSVTVDSVRPISVGMWIPPVGGCPRGRTADKCVRRCGPEILAASGSHPHRVRTAAPTATDTPTEGMAQTLSDASWRAFSAAYQGSPITARGAWCLALRISAASR